MLLYLLKSGICLAALLVFYKLFLERESLHTFKRFYLLGALVFSFIIPALVFTERVVVYPSTETVATPFVGASPAPQVPQKLTADIVDIAPLLWGIYFLGLAFFGIRFFKQLFQIVKRIRSNPKERTAPFTRVLLEEYFPPHTFFHYIFLNREKLRSDEIPEAVLLHEETHAKQIHSIDVVLIEVLLVLLWFHPLLYFFRKAIKLNHEFLADRAVLKKGVASSTYQNTLLSYMAPKGNQSFINAINYSSIKKRFTVMKTQTSKKVIVLKSIVLLPLLALLFFSFTESRVITVFAEKTAVPPLHENDRENDQENNSETESLDVQDPKAEIPSTSGLSEEALANYGVLAQKYLKQPKEDRKIPLEDLRQLEAAYQKMTPAQKAAAPPFPECAQTSKKELVILIENNRIVLNGEVVTLDAFPKKIDAYTANWEETDYTEASTQVQLRNVSNDFLDKVDAAFKKTHFSKANGGTGIVPPPPPPPVSPSMGHTQGVHPVEPLHSPEVEIVEDEITEIIEHQEVYNEQSIVHSPTAPIAVGVLNTGQIKSSYTNSPPSPPEPQSPLDLVIELAKEGAAFFYKGNGITSDRAIDILKNNEKLSIDVSRKNGKTPVVKIDTHF
ncbi:M56 family metallopeptidase [Maribacter sp. 2-571]|uniref:M56 family metallopeptidase n=1 Tax=Maribacter sp. 2-571 TaxID=3417569 RepID=UPI003D3519C3